ncbi:MAG: ABC transporter substrate-binding protein [Actinomycetota bacterium]
MTSRRLILTAALMALVAVACGGARAGGTKREPARNASIVIGSFDFSESRVLGELYAVALEEHGYDVTRSFDIGSRELVEPALEQGKIDFVPEYLGAALTFASLGEAELTSSPSQMAAALNETLIERGIEALAYGPAQDRNGIVVTQETATEYNLIRISDLEPFAPELTFGGPPECAERPLCLVGLEEVYDLEFAGFQPLDVGGPATVAALEGGEVDVALLFTTDPNIEERDFVLLTDDRRLQPAENVVPLARSEVLGRNADMRELVDDVTIALSTDELRRLNRLVDLEGKDRRAVAHAWLLREGLVE